MKCCDLFLTTLLKLLKIDNQEILKYATMAASIFSATGEDIHKSRNMILSNIILLLAKETNSEIVISNCLKIMGNYSTDDTSSQSIWKSEAFKSFPEFLKHSNPKIQRNCCFVLSGMVESGNPDKKVEKIIDGNLLSPLIVLLKKGDEKAKKIATRVIYRISMFENSLDKLLKVDSLDNLSETHFFDSFSLLLMDVEKERGNSDYASNVLSGIYNILTFLNNKERIAERDAFIKKLLDNGIANVIVGLKSAANNILCEKATEICKYYFDPKLVPC